MPFHSFDFVEKSNKKRPRRQTTGCPFKVKGAIFISLIGHFQFHSFNSKNNPIVFSIHFKQIFVWQQIVWDKSGRQAAIFHSFGIRSGQQVLPEQILQQKSRWVSATFLSFFWQGQDHLEAGQLVFQLLLVPNASPCAKKKTAIFSQKKKNRNFQKLPVVVQ